MFGALAAVSTLSWSFYPGSEPAPVLERALGAAAERTSAMALEQTSVVATTAGEAAPPVEAPPASEAHERSLGAPREFVHRPPHLPAKDLGF